MVKEWNGRSEEILKTEVSEEILETVVSDENLETVVSDKARKAYIFIKTPQGDRDLGRWIYRLRGESAHDARQETVHQVPEYANQCHHCRWDKAIVARKG